MFYSPSGGGAGAGASTSFSTNEKSNASVSLSYPEKSYFPQLQALLNSIFQRLTREEMLQPKAHSLLVYGMRWGSERGLKMWRLPGEAARSRGQSVGEMGIQKSFHLVIILGGRQSI